MVKKASDAYQRTIIVMDNAKVGIYNSPFQLQKIVFVEKKPVQLWYFPSIKTIFFPYRTRVRALAHTERLG
jgi:hypothetical protein